MIDLLQLQKAEVSFVLTDDERVHQLNKVYRGKDRPTDVLAFAMHEGEFGALAGHLLGDVIVSVPTARKQALARRAGPEADRVRTDAAVLDEVTMLLAHGLLHLLGWDHDTPAKDRRMRAETARLCAAAAPPSSTSVPRARVSKGRAAKPLTQKRSGGRPARRRS
ncbi:MAG: rRNA maturation RNase YbeY [Deltaproteobacteria bacterium]|nr:rRNA maturation RNase YbeY [Deltaproteobacteria bacterium]